MMFILFFAIRDGQGMLATLRALIPMPAMHKARLFDHLAAVTRALVYGTVVTAHRPGRAHRRGLRDRADGRTPVGWVPAVWGGAVGTIDIFRAPDARCRPRGGGRVAGVQPKPAEPLSKFEIAL